MTTKKMTIEEAMVLLQAIRATSKHESNQCAFNLPFAITYALARNIKSLQEALEVTQEENREIFEGWPEESAEILSRRSMAENKEERERISAEHAAAFGRRNDRWKTIIAQEIELEVYEIPELKPEDQKKLEESGMPANLIADLEPLGIFEAIQV